MAIVLVFGNLSVVKAATKPWETAYTSILNNWKIVESYASAGTDYLKNYFGTEYKFDQYFLCDVDNNKVPELFLYSSTMGLTVVFTYKNGILVCLGTDKFYKINTSKKVLIVKGHWHGSGGSGDKEYFVYKIGGNSLDQKYYIDYMDKYSVYKNDNWDNAQRTKKAYDEVYKEYIKSGKLFSKYTKYTLSDKKGLYGKSLNFNKKRVNKTNYINGTDEDSYEISFHTTKSGDIVFTIHRDGKQILSSSNLTIIDLNTLNYKNIDTGWNINLIWDKDSDWAFSVTGKTAAYKGIVGSEFGEPNKLHSS